MNHWALVILNHLTSQFHGYPLLTLRDRFQENCLIFISFTGGSDYAVVQVRTTPYSPYRTNSGPQRVSYSVSLASWGLSCAPELLLSTSVLHSTTLCRHDSCGSFPREGTQLQVLLIRLWQSPCRPTNKASLWACWALLKNKGPCVQGHRFLLHIYLSLLDF